MPPRSLSLIALALSVLVAAGCTRRARPDEAPTPESLEPGIYHVESGRRLDPGELIDELSDRRFIVLGEKHDEQWHHEIQTRIFEGVSDRGEGGFALGMEMFKRPFQSTLDAYVAGEIEEEAMLEQTEWKSRWGMDPALYRPLWRAARQRGLPIAALNARRELTRKIARVGLDGLSDRERAELPATIDTSIEAQRDYMEMVLGGGEHGGKMNLDYFIEAQATWDETMAETAVAFLKGHPSVAGMVIVAGRAHARADFGIPPRIARRLGAETDRVASLIPFEAGRAQPFGPLTLENLRRRQIADYVWVK